MTLLRLFLTISLQTINEDNLNERDDYGVPFSDQQCRHRSYYIPLFKYNFIDQSDPRINQADMNFKKYGTAMASNGNINRGI